MPSFLFFFFYFQFYLWVLVALVVQWGIALEKCSPNSHGRVSRPLPCSSPPGGSLLSLGRICEAKWRTVEVKRETGAQFPRKHMPIIHAGFRSCLVAPLAGCFQGKPAGGQRGQAAPLSRTDVSDTREGSATLRPWSCPGTAGKGQVAFRLHPVPGLVTKDTGASSGP